MPVDLVELDKAVSRVRDGGYTSTTVKDIAELLDQARREIIRLEGEIPNLQSQVDGMREHATALKDAAAQQATDARELLAQARALEQAREDALAIAKACGAFVAQRDALDATREALMSEIATMKANAQALNAQRMKAIDEAKAELKTVKARDAAKAEQLEQIKALPWYKAHVAKRIADAKPRS